MIKMEKCKNPLYEEEAQVSKIFSRLGPLSSLMRDAVQLKLEFEKFNKNQNIKIFNPSAIFHFKTIRILICDNCDNCFKIGDLFYQHHGTSFVFWHWKYDEYT